MGRSSVSGPFVGAYQTLEVLVAPGLSATDLLVIAHTFDSDARLCRISVRTLGLGTGTVTAHKVRRAAAVATAVVVGDTQVLSADGGAIAANAINAIEPDLTTPTILAAQRDYTKGQQIGVFVSTDGGTANKVVAQLVFYTKGFVNTAPSEATGIERD